MPRLINARILTMEGRELENGYIAFENGRITSLGSMADTAPATGDTDVRGGYVLPGIVEPHVHIGLRREGGPADESSADEKTRLNAADMCALDGVYPLDPAMGKCLASGITAVACAPGTGAMFGGSVCVMKPWGVCADKMVLEGNAGIKATLGEPLLFPRGKKKKAPATRLGAAALFRKTLTEAARYAEKKARGEDVYDAALDALIPVMKGEKPLFIRVLRSDDIGTALRILEGYPIRPVLLHAFGFEPYGDELRQRHIPVIAGPLLIRTSDRVEERLGQATPDVPARLFSAGIDFAVSTFSVSSNMRSPVPAWFWPMHLGGAVRAGLDADDALRAVTVNAARLLGVDARIGSLAVGKDADIAVFTGHPLDFQTKVQMVFTDGLRRL